MEDLCARGLFADEDDRIRINATTADTLNRLAAGQFVSLFPWHHLPVVKSFSPCDPRFTLRITLTRDTAPGWSGAIGRINLPALKALLEDLGGVTESFVCGPAGFVEVASALLVQAGQSADAIRTERFGPTGA